MSRRIGNPNSIGATGLVPMGATAASSCGGLTVFVDVTWTSPTIVSRINRKAAFGRTTASLSYDGRTWFVTIASASHVAPMCVSIASVFLWQVHLTLFVAVGRVPVHHRSL
jgi:hypothetical protein